MSAVATKKRSGKKKLTYLDLMALTSKPIADRRLVPIGRGGEKIVPRNFHLGKEEIEVLREKHEGGDKLPNPQNRGSYFYIIEALKDLGLNRKHPFGDVFNKIKELMSDKSTVKEDDKGNKTTAWQRFRDKAPATKDEDRARDERGRVLQNMEVLQRVNVQSCTPYGLKLFQVGTEVLKTAGCVIDILKDTDGKVFVRLNTNSDSPQNDMRRRRVTDGAVEAKPAKKPGKKAKAVAKPKAAKVAKAKAARKPKAAAKAEHSAPSHSAPAAESDKSEPAEVKETENAGSAAE
jgi:hypothetical protein